MNYEDIVFKFLSENQNDDYIGVICYGSYVKNQADTLSDIDLMIFTKNDNASYFGSHIEESIRIEYFIYNLKDLYKYAKEAIENNDPSHLTKFTTSKILIDKTGEISEFIDYVNKIYSTKIEIHFNDDDKLNIVSIKNKIDDLIQVINSDSFYSVYYNTLERIRNTYSKIFGFIELPIEKYERLITDKDYFNSYIKPNTHTLPDSEFINKYLDCIKLDNKEKMYEKILDLYNYCFKTLDINPEEFRLKLTRFI